MTKETATAQEFAPVEKDEPENHLPSELAEPMWSVVTHEAVAASGLIYEEAEKLARRLEAEKVSGICLITDQAAGRISG